MAQRAVYAAVAAVLLFAGLAQPARSQSLGGKSGVLGTMNFPVSCTPEAQKHFNRAALLLYSYYWVPTEKALSEVLEADPACVMAYWAAAVAKMDNPYASPPTPKALEESWRIIQKAKAIGAKTERERDYIDAIEVFYKDYDKLDHRTRGAAHEKALEQVYLRYPQDTEAAMYYARWLIAMADPSDKSYTRQLKAAQILEKIFAAQPDHPGAAHFLIHAYDHPPIANRGLEPAKRYAAIAPAAPHALHMPSHIFTRVGYWQESIETNRRAAEVAKGQRDEPHALDYMAYGYLQLAQDVEAKRVVDRIMEFAKQPMPLIGPAYAFAAIPARYALERGKWSEAAQAPLPLAGTDQYERFPNAEAVNAFARALGAARSGNSAAAKQEIARLDRLRGKLVAMKQAYWAEQVEIQAKVASAWVARVEGRNDEALALLRQAADQEDKTGKHPVTPGPLIPAREALGDLLVEIGQPAAALKEYEASQKVEPNRFRSIYGAARASELAGDIAKARTYYSQLVKLAEKASGDREELRQARSLLARH
jgi:tetratricopeptide (TPR) repeat protein